MIEYKYPAVKIRQLQEVKEVIAFGAPCDEIICWGGIPRKEEHGDSLQTIGFQRADVPRRVREIRDFLHERKNIIANPILCATRDDARVKFSPSAPSEDRVQNGVLTIQVEDFSSLNLQQTLEAVLRLLESRVSRLSEIEIPEPEIQGFIAQLPEEDLPSDSDDEASEPSLDEEAEEEDGQTADQDDIGESSLSFSTDSHIDDFYQAIKLRSLAVARLGIQHKQSIGGITKDDLINYLRPAFIVDGQHRLLGAVKEWQRGMLSDDAIQLASRLASEGVPQETARQRVRETMVRYIPVSLINNPDWSEHVFQFVVVNQKATPIPKALLASIVATTLADSEIDRISKRLTDAGIPVEDYITISYLNLSSDSPFRGLIKRGYGERESDKKLEMTVVDRLVQIFRQFKGGRSLHEKRSPDYASQWGSLYLSNFKFLDNYEAQGAETRMAYWSQADGPWREFFCRFWNTVRRLGSTDEDPSAGNIWGYPKRSNLFNGVHLQILAADFFYFLCNRRPVVDRLDQTDSLVEDQWLEFVKHRMKEYFARDWRLEGVKKTDASVKTRWASLWKGFREDHRGRLPGVQMYRP